MRGGMEEEEALGTVEDAALRALETSRAERWLTGPTSNGLHTTVRRVS